MDLGHITDRGSLNHELHDSNTFNSTLNQPFYNFFLILPYWKQIVLPVSFSVSDNLDYSSMHYQGGQSQGKQQRQQFLVLH